MALLLFSEIRIGLPIFPCNLFPCKFLIRNAQTIMFHYKLKQIQKLFIITLFYAASIIKTKVLH